MSLSPRPTRLRLLRSAIADASGSDQEGSSWETLDSGEELFVRGLVLVYKDQNFVAGLEILSRARAQFEAVADRGECLIEEAHVHSLLGHLEDAEASLDESLSLLPVDAEGLRGEASHHLARVLARQGRFERALQAHLAARSFYADRSRDGLAEFHGFESWLRERLGDYRGWVSAVRALLGVAPDKLALHRIPPSNERTLRRLEGLLRGLEGLLAEPYADTDWVLALKAMVWFIARRSEQSLEILQPLVERKPDFGFAQHLYAKCLIRRRQSRRALEHLNLALEASGEYFDLLLDLAMVTEILGDYGPAIGYYDRLSALDRAQVLPVARAAVLNETLDRKLEAVLAYQQLNERDPRNRSALVRLALLNAELERDEDALSWLERALEATGPDPTLLMTRARVYLRLDRLREGLKDARRAVELLQSLSVGSRVDIPLPVPGSDDAPSPAGLPAAPAGALELSCSSAGRLLAQARLTQAQLCRRLGRVADAASLVAEVLAESPENEEALLLAGDCERVQGSAESAVANYKKVIDKVLCESLVQAGRALSSEGRHGEALQKFRDAYARFPDNWAVFYNSALAYAQLGELASAAKYLRVARRINRDVPNMVVAEPLFAELRASEFYTALEPARPSL